MNTLEKLKELASTRSAKIAYILAVILVSIKSRKKLAKVYVSVKKEISRVLEEARNEVDISNV